jgi:hypothetical protein
MLLVSICALAVPASALAHVERPAYWPDPAPDCSMKPCAGGDVPKARSLSSALKPSSTSKTRVVCHKDSMSRLLGSVGDARKHGFHDRPTLPLRRMSLSQARTFTTLNRKFQKRCKYDSIQAAVNASHNNDRIVVMPGIYDEPASRAAPTHDPACSKYLQDSPGGAGLSYRYQFHCPNDQALVNILGRGLGPVSDENGPGAAPDPARKDRHGIPDNGPCIRCNLQIDGSGVKPSDVAIDSGDTRAGDGGPSAVGSVKDVALKADRADGLVLRNFTVRHSSEHALYILETDGYLMDRMHYLYAGEYGHLTFASDHGLTEDCEAKGSGDAGVYPGGAPDTGAQTIESKPRYNQEIRFCDVHHNGQGNSGTMGNAVLLDHNNFYDNVIGINTDSLYPGGHPGYPQDSAMFLENNVYSNNFDMYAPDSDVKPDVYGPTGTGILTTGGNENKIIGNRIWDNWRRGTMLIAVPNQVSELDGGSGIGQTGGVESTSFNNLYQRNIMGIAPDGTKMPNGVDFWWDQHPGNTGNRWCGNTGIDGKVTMDPPAPLMPGCDGPSVGTGNPVKDAELYSCGGPQALNLPSVNCNWFQKPPKPGSGKSYSTNVPRPTLDLGCGLSSVRSGLALLGCGGTSKATLFSKESTRSLQTTSCSDWRHASQVQRMQILAGLASAATTPDPENVGPTLAEGPAYQVFQSRCSPKYASNILLYEIYNRAASFQSLGR